MGNVTANGGVAYTNPASATLNKVATSVNLTKAFSPTTLSGPGSVSCLTVANLSATTLTDLGVVDNLPAGMVVEPSRDAPTTCAGGIVNGLADATSVALSAEVTVLACTRTRTSCSRGTGSSTSRNARTSGPP